MNETIIWDNCWLIGEVAKSDRLKIRVELVARDGVKQINVREWYFKKTTQEWKPGLNGFSIPLLIPMAGELVKPCDALIPLFKEAIDKSVDFPIEDKNNIVYSLRKPAKPKKETKTNLLRNT